MIRRLTNLCVKYFPAACLLVAAVLMLDAWCPDFKNSIHAKAQHFAAEIVSSVRGIDWGTRHWIIGSTAMLAAAATIRFVPRWIARVDNEGRFKSRYRSVRSWMRPKWKVSVLILSMLTVIGWTGIEQFKGDIATNAFSAPTSGFLPRVINQVIGGPSKYLVFVPHDYEPSSDRRWPTLIYLNGAGQNGDDGFAQISRNFGRPIWEMQRGFPFFVIAPQCASGKNWSHDLDQFDKALQALDAVSADYKLDPQRIYLTGVSAGASSAVEVISDHSDRFAAVLAVAPTGVNDVKQVVEPLVQAGIPIWHIHNEHDELYKSDQADLSETLWRSGADFCLTTYDRDGHDAWSYAYRDAAVYRWLLSKQRDRPASSFRPLDRPTASWNGEGVFRVDMHLSQAWQLHLEQVNDVGKVINRLPTLTLQCLDVESAAPVDKSEKNGGFVRYGGELLGGLALRPDAWNQIEVSRNDNSVGVYANGCRLASWTDSIKESDGLRVNLQMCEGSSALSSDPNNSDKVTFRFPRLQCRNTDSIPMLESSETATQIQSDSESNVGFIDKLVLNRTVQGANQIQWKIDNLMQGGPRLATLEVGMESVSFETQTWHPKIVVKLSDSTYPMQPLVDFSDALLRIQKRIPQQVGWPLTPWRRTASCDSITDQWEGTDWCPRIAVEKSRSSEDPKQWARLTVDTDLNHQLDWLSAHAALMAVSGLEHPVLMIHWESVEAFPEREMIGGVECVKIVERSEDKQCQRFFWIAADGPSRVHRFQGSVTPMGRVKAVGPGALQGPDNDVFIEIEYSATGPVGWTVASTHAPGSPLIACGYARDVDVRRLSTSNEAFEAKTFQPQSRLRGFANTSLPYLWMAPESATDFAFGTEATERPLVIVLHGAGNCGSDLEGVRSFLDDLFCKPSHRTNYPCFVAAPQCPQGGTWQDLSHGFANEIFEEWMDWLCQNHFISPSRIYLIGASMGGAGVWQLIQMMPDRFAAAICVAGWAQVDEAAILAKVPTWVIHGDEDRVIPVQESRRIVSAIKSAGGTARLTIYRGVGHDSWNVFRESPDEYLSWIFDQ